MTLGQSRMMRRTSVGALAVGDQFCRVEDPDTVWTVRQLVDLQNLPKHAVLTCEKPAYRRIMVSGVVLRDKRLYRQVPAAPADGKSERRKRRGWGWLFGH